jgi:DNA polymerase-1
VLGLPFRQIWLLDFEFVSESGAVPVPVCMVARELISNSLVRLWQDELGAEPPFPIDDDTLFVAYFASAELGCFLALGWPPPVRVLDLYSEFRNATNGIPLPGGRSYLSALSHHGISAITAEQKTEERALVMGGGPWSTTERRRILDYCQTDVDPLGVLLERMLPGILARPNGFGQALLRGRYMAAVAKMERTGVPIDYETLERLRIHWDDIKLDLISAIDKNYGVYEGKPCLRLGCLAGGYLLRLVRKTESSVGVMRDGLCVTNSRTSYPRLWICVARQRARVGALVPAIRFISAQVNKTRALSASTRALSASRCNSCAS